MIRTLRANWRMVYVLPFLGAALSGCEQKQYTPPEDQSVLFEYHYINHAWGFQESGWLIDGEGNIRSFNLPGDYRHASHEETLSPEDLEHNLGETDAVIDQIAASELEKYAGYILAAAEGEIEELHSVAADAGSHTLGCYLYDSDEDAYQYILLAAGGDWKQKNLSAEAESLVEWLAGFGAAYWFSE